MLVGNLERTELSVEQNMQQTLSLGIRGMREIKEGKGFTLVEVLVVLTIITILIAVAVPAFLAWRPNIHYRQAGRDLFLDMQLAKMEAVKRNVNVGVILNEVGSCPAEGTAAPVPEPGGSYSLFYDDGSGAGGVRNDNIKNGSEETIKNVSLPKYVAFCDKSIAVNFGFQPEGLPFTAAPIVYPIELTIQNETGRAGLVSLSLAGNISLNLTK
jgi:type IV fimbrial biogenesis protein FimT